MTLSLFIIALVAGLLAAFNSWATGRGHTSRWVRNGIMMGLQAALVYFLAGQIDQTIASPLTLTLVFYLLRSGDEARNELDMITGPLTKEGLWACALGYLPELVPMVLFSIAVFWYEFGFHPLVLTPLLCLPTVLVSPYATKKVAATNLKGEIEWDTSKDFNVLGAEAREKVEIATGIAIILPAAFFTQLATLLLVDDLVRLFKWLVALAT